VWVRYSSAWEVNKRTCNDEATLPHGFRKALAYLGSKAFVDVLRHHSGIADLIPAPYQHGGGVHIMDPGGRLDCHLDFARHPAAPFLERRLSLIVFCSTSSGGRLELWNDDARQVVADYCPLSGSAVLFENSDLSYHSVNQVTGAVPRVTLAAYYCSPIRSGVVRKRALWVPVRS
jgi:Rps23 Pro-64 3,4-dihydroxylase Tpa1-like proline 4-hydroxylase